MSDEGDDLPADLRATVDRAIGRIAVGNLSEGAGRPPVDTETRVPQAVAEWVDVVWWARLDPAQRLAVYGMACVEYGPGRA